MFLVGVLRVEPCQAVSAVEHALATVYLDVCLQIGKSGECLHTDFTLQPVLQFDVLGELCGAGEDLVTLCAAQVLGVRVDLRDVGTKLPQEGKGGFTLVTLVWLAVHVHL